MLAREEFYQAIREAANKKLNGEYGENGLLLENSKYDDGTEAMTMIFTTEREISPGFNLDYYYQEYISGKPLEEFVEHIVDASLSYQKFLKETNNLCIDDYETIKERICAQLYTNENAKKLPVKQIRQELGYYTVAFFVSFECEGQYFVLISIRDTHLEKWGLSKNELWEQTMANQRRDGVLFMPLADEFGKMENPEQCSFWGKPVFPEDLEGIRCFCLTNRKYQNGASLIANQEIMAEIGELLGKNYYVLISSIHELLILPDSDYMNVQSARALLDQFFGSDMESSERFESEVYYYSGELGYIISGQEYLQIRSARLREVQNRIIQKCAMGS